jgi:hypothetical protein
MWPSPRNGRAGSPSRRRIRRISGGPTAPKDHVSSSPRRPEEVPVRAARRPARS